MLQYKIVEITEVTASKLEDIVNEWVLQGWTLDGFQFITPESARRPTLAFVLFTAEVVETIDGQDSEPDLGAN